MTRILSPAPPTVPAQPTARPAPARPVRVDRGAAPVFSVTVDQATRRLVVLGEFDTATVGHFLDAASILADGRVGDVTVDLAGVRFIDAAGLGALVALRNTLGRGGHALVVRGVQPRVRRVFAVARLVELLPD